MTNAEKWGEEKAAPWMAQIDKGPIWRVRVIEPDGRVDLYEVEAPSATVAFSKAHPRHPARSRIYIERAATPCYRDSFIGRDQSTLATWRLQHSLSPAPLDGNLGYSDDPR